MYLDGFSLTDYLTKSLVVVPIILGIVQAIKMTAIPERYSAIISIVIGILIAFITANGTYWGYSIMGGLIYGLSASGLYSGTKAVMDQQAKKKVDK